MLLTDLYQLTMLQAYARAGMNGTAVFELFVRRLPPTRNFLLAAGLEQALEFLQGARFTRDEIDWLAHCGRFDKSFVRDLADWRFGGDVWAVPEGTPVFGGEPLLRVVAPIAQAQIVETRLINLLQLPTLVASKAARCVLAAPRKLLIDFGLRRAHGAEAGLLSARAAYLAGFAGTATVAAGQAWDIPLFGTMAHSYVQACGDEKAAFRNYAEAFPAASAVLIDTYDSLAAARKVVELAREGVNIGAVRIDSGDLAAQARAVRALFDAAGLAGTRILASGDLDEYRLRELEAAAAPIDGYGVGTRMNTSMDAPALDMVYKLQEYAGRPCGKRSPQKSTLPGRKQVFRRLGPDDCLAGDTLALEDAALCGERLLQPVMRAGRMLAPAPGLAALREHAARQLARLPQPLRDLDAAPAYRVEIDAGLQAMAAGVPVQAPGGAMGGRS